MTLAKRLLATDIEWDWTVKNLIHLRVSLIGRIKSVCRSLLGTRHLRADSSLLTRQIRIHMAAAVYVNTIY